jgi:hypothetical protein
MKISLPILKTILFFVWSNAIFASPKDSLLSAHLPLSAKYDSLKKDKEVAPFGKICACQILQLQSLNHRPRNYALFAERTNRKSFFYDSHRAKWRIEKEKKHLTDFFYDKLEVLDDFVEISDCRSVFIKMKKKQKSLILYDILDADVKR